ncbi:MAG: hypothetical protein CVV21_11160 [Candidatus Goldiibacteriota bacterium HGW-Goldbacteria-1]|jgi:outer membrane lipoprotein-sorting protein|nr:MAG: hypothetical protein CVV21_11160 [Candidatus Goldiibacteriota bacterium HGW-Goldbacteria-1]
MIKFKGKHMKKILFLFALTFVFVLGVFGESAFKYIPYKSASWEIKTVVEGSYPMKMDQKVFYKSNKMRIEGVYKNPDSGKNEEQVIIVTNESTYMYMPQSKSGFKYSNKSDSNPQKLSNVQAQYRDKAKKTGSEKVNGVACEIWQYTIDEDGETMEVKEWRGKDGFIYRTVSETIKGDKSKYTSDVISLKKDVKLADSLFEIPGDIKMVDMENLLKGMQPDVKKTGNKKAVQDDSGDESEEEAEDEDISGQMQEKAAKEAADMLKGMFGQ